MAASLLTTDQKFMLYSALNVIYGTHYWTLSAMGQLAVDTFTASPGQVAASDALSGFLDGISGTDTETRLKALLVQYAPLENKTTGIRGGAVGKMTNVFYEPSETRNLIINRIQDIVPFFHFGEIEARRDADVSGSNHETGR